MTEGGKVVAHKQLSGGSGLVGMEDGVTDDPTGSSLSMGVAMSVRLLAEWWFEAQHCQAWWSLYLSQFNYSLAHRAGRHSAKPDALSRRVNHQPEGDDNEDQVMLPAE